MATEEEVIEQLDKQSEGLAAGAGIAEVEEENYAHSLGSMNELGRAVDGSLAEFARLRG